jgi:hypothetical protein
MVFFEQSAPSEAGVATNWNRLMSNETNPYDPPSLGKTRFENPAIARYRKIGRIGILLFLVCLTFFGVAGWLQWRGELGLSNDEFTEYLWSYGEVLVAAAALPLCSWWLQRSHRNDHDQSQPAD